MTLSVGLVSLWDMLRFYAVHFAALMSQIARASEAVWIVKSGLPATDQAARQLLNTRLEGIEKEFDELPLSAVLKNQVERLQRSLQRTSPDELSLLLRELHNNICVELSSFYFVAIKPDRREFYEQREPTFGPLVQKEFPLAGLDIAAASRCLALDEWTACVFHLMRVLEHGLRWLAADMGLKPEQIANENWKIIIDLIEKEIRKLEQLPKSQEKIDKSRFVSDAAVNFRYFKDAWRNHVAHAQQNYDEISATSIYLHVRSFMQTLANHLNQPDASGNAWPA